MQEAISSHLLEIARQHMLEEAVDELLGWYGGDFCGAGFAMAPAECNRSVLKGEDALVADSDAEDVGRQVLQGCLATADGDDIHDPVLLPEPWRSLVEEACLFEQIAEFGTKDSSQGFFWQEVVVSGHSPLAIGRQSSCGYQVVHMG